MKEDGGESIPLLIAAIKQLLLSNQDKIRNYIPGVKNSVNVPRQRKGKRTEESKSLCLSIPKEVRRLVKYRVKMIQCVPVVCGNRTVNIYLVVDSTLQVSKR